ncbi:unnamed protein product [Absidia cylindrospora]
MKTSSTTHTDKSTSDNSKKIGRPINCFLAFRLEKYREVSSRCPGLNHRDISKIVANWWKKATETEKAPYRAIAEKAKADHAKRYPNYKYKPVKKSERKVRQYRRREDAATREQKANAVQRLLKPWLNDEHDEEMDNKSETSFYSPTPSFSSSGSGNFCSLDIQPCPAEMAIKREPGQLNDSSTFSPSLNQPVFHENLIYRLDTKSSDTTVPDCAFYNKDSQSFEDISDCAFFNQDIKPFDDIPDCAFTSSQFSSVDLMSDLFIGTPNYANLQMDDNPFFML